jgi:hypothetical protein
MRAILILAAIQAAAADEHLEAVRKAIAKTAASSYAYEVKGKYERSGEFGPDDVLTSRIKQYQSARRGELILVKGPEGLWKTPDERLGEKVERPDPEAAPIVRILQETEPPHRILERALACVEKGRAPEDREVDGVLCQRYVLALTPGPLKEYLTAQIEKAVKAGTLARPDEIRWSSSMKGSIAVYVSKKDGRLVKVKDERSVKVATKVPDAQPDVKTYKLEMEFDFSRWGDARPELPKEVKDRLGLKGD